LPLPYFAEAYLLFPQTISTPLLLTISVSIFLAPVIPTVINGGSSTSFGKS
jgi:hypothetical protein